MSPSQPIPINVPLGSEIDIFIAILVIVGVVLGLRRGVIVECISMFAVLVILTISVNISKLCYTEMLINGSIIADLIAMILMTILFILGLIFVVSRVNFYTMKAVAGTVAGPIYKYLGAFFGGLKFYFISAVFLVSLFTVDKYSKFLPDSARDSQLSRGSIWIVTSIFPYLQMDKWKEPHQFDRPPDSNNNTEPTN
ncbi:MAG: CvpA family protein [Bacteroidales bacterium]|jgi:uncharacterized membrane protein required for colicin V production|nr:CvpA family protein [Bacteroidales bacterium]